MYYYYNIFVLTMKTNLKNPNIMTTKKYITPTKKRNIFIASCTDFGLLKTSRYYMWLVGDTCGDTFATSYAEAIQELHDRIIDIPSWVKDYPKAKFEIYAMDGTLDKFGQPNQRKVYVISSSKAKKFLF